MEKRLPIPKNWQDFERICHKLWREIWNDPNAQMNGRQGQPQFGVDVWGSPAYLNYYAGIQCKDKDSRLGSVLSKGEIKSECEKAQVFTPALEEFTIATTASRETDLQTYTRTLNSEQRFPFEVFVWSWEDIEEEIRYRPALFEHFYSGLQLDSSDFDRVTMSFVYQKQQAHAFFSRPGIQARIPPSLLELLLPLVYELSDNAFRHGKASQFSLVCEDNAIHFEDNGMPFNPLKELDSSKVSRHGYVGSLILDTFLREFHNVVKVEYHQKSSDRKGLNRVSFRFSQPTWSLERSVRKEIPVNVSMVTTRASADRLAATIPLAKDTKNLTVSIEGMASPSAIVEFIGSLADRAGDKVSIVFYVPLPEPYLVELRKWFPSERLILRPRL